MSPTTFEQNFSHIHSKKWPCQLKQNQLFDKYIMHLLYEYVNLYNNYVIIKIDLQYLYYKFIIIAIIIVNVPMPSTIKKKTAINPKLSYIASW